ncbi:MAG: ABC transporter permease [Anaerolineae bacterium]
MRFAALWALVRRELRALARERTILIAFGIQLFIASFSSTLLMGLISIYDPDATQLAAQLRPRVAVVGEQDAATNTMVALLEAHQARPRVVEDEEEAQALYEAGQLDAAILMPTASTSGLGGSSVAVAELVLPSSQTEASLLRLVLRKPLRDYENVLREANGIELRYQDLEGVPPTTYEFQYAALVPLLLFFPAFVTGGMVIDTVSEEMVNRTLETLWSTPVSLNAILLAKMTAALLVSAGQSLLWMGLLTANGIQIARPVAVFALIAMGGVTVAQVAALLSLVFRDRERSQFVYALFILLVASGSYLVDASPVILVSRLATSDPTVGWGAVLIYGGLALGLGLVLRRVSRPLIAGS